MDIVDVYQEVKEIKISDYKRIALVYSAIDNLYYIKRELKYYDKEVYLQLQHCSSLHIPNIIHVKEKEGVLIVIEEYINAPTLDTYLCNNDLTEGQVIDIMKQLCDCLQLLHTLKHPIIHRDIKPENIFYDRGRVVLFDFDIARIYDVCKNKDTVILGSVGYAAPEQFGFGQSDTRSDIYALGVLLNVLLTKQLPQQLLHNGRYRKIIVKSTNVDRNKRYRNVDEFKNAIDNHKLVIPGINNQTIAQKVACIISFICIVAIAVECYHSGTKDLSPFIFGIVAFLYLYSAEFLLCNSFLCLFNKNKYFIIRLIGKGITYFIVLFLITLLAQFINSMLSAYQLYF